MLCIFYYKIATLAKSKAALFTKTAQRKDIYIYVLEQLLVVYLWRRFSDAHLQMKIDVR